jgi:hypothetical protein
VPLVIMDAPITLENRTLSVVGAATFTGTVASFTDGNPSATAANFSAVLTWGSSATSTASIGSITLTAGTFTVTGTHKFAAFTNVEPLTVEIIDQFGTTATVTDDIVDPKKPRAPFTATTPPTVQNASLSVVANKLFSGTVARFTDTDVKAVAADFTAIITWDDGTVSLGTITLLRGGIFTVTGKHKFAAFSGVQQLSITIIDAADNSAAVVDSVIE